MLNDSTINDFTVIGDPHITKKSKDKGHKLFQMVEALGVNAIWLGDLLDTKEMISGICQNMFYDYFKSSKLHHIVIVGNHDYFNLECKDHSLKTLGALPNVTIVDSIYYHPTLPMIFFPYIHDKAALKQLLKQHSNPDLIAVGHFEVSGFDFGNGHLCEDGIVTMEDFAGFKRVISGHFHKLQQTGNFIYLGTPFSHSFGEANQEKVIGHYITSSDELILSPTDFPRHVSFKADLSKTTTVKKLNEFMKDNVGNLIRIQLHGTPEQTTAFNKAQYEEYQVKWEDKSESTVNSNQVLDETLDNKSQFQSWAKDIRKLDKATTKLGLEILETLNAK